MSEYITIEPGQEGKYYIPPKQLQKKFPQTPHYTHKEGGLQEDIFEMENSEKTPLKWEDKGVTSSGVRYKYSVKPFGWSDGEPSWLQQTKLSAGDDYYNEQNRKHIVRSNGERSIIKESNRLYFLDPVTGEYSLAKPQEVSKEAEKLGMSVRDFVEYSRRLYQQATPEAADAKPYLVSIRESMTKTLTPRGWEVTHYCFGDLFNFLAPKFAKGMKTSDLAKIIQTFVKK